VACRISNEENKNLMRILVSVKDPEAWERALEKALEAQKGGHEVVFLVLDKGVSRCIRCEPDLFKHLHQFVLNGGQALVCLKSLAENGIPASRPPDVFERISDGWRFKEEFEGERLEF
jgi:hypothetical protein